ncbi:hypothetical protein GGD62_000858 [Bradyrhizobium sp. ERR14]|nr:hypothetical protein [Bradyrhizobium sp. ERR14]
MADVAAMVGLLMLMLGCTSALIGAGMAAGTRYIDRTLRVDARPTPLVRPSHPSGSNWRVDAA